MHKSFNLQKRFKNVYTYLTYVSLLLIADLREEQSLILTTAMADERSKSTTALQNCLKRCKTALLMTRTSYKTKVRGQTEKYEASEVRFVAERLISSTENSSLQRELHDTVAHLHKQAQKLHQLRLELQHEQEQDHQPDWDGDAWGTSSPRRRAGGRSRTTIGNSSISSEGGMCELYRFLRRRQRQREAEDRIDRVRLSALLKQPPTREGAKLEVEIEKLFRSGSETSPVSPALLTRGLATEVKKMLGTAAKKTKMKKTRQKQNEPRGESLKNLIIARELLAAGATADLVMEEEEKWTAPRESLHRVGGGFSPPPPVGRKAARKKRAAATASSRRIDRLSLGLSTTVLMRRSTGNGNTL